MKLGILLLTLALATAESTRDFIDPVGFSTKREQIEAVITHSRSCKDMTVGEPPPTESPLLAAVCPHDDHIYAGPVYLPVMERIEARHLILIGVFHKAWKWEIEDVLIFDDFDSWSGPFGPIPVDVTFRKAVKEELSGKTFIVSNEYHQAEHSLEAFVAFIQHFDPEASILPILVPYMGWDRMDQLARDLSGAVSEVMTGQGLRWGKDVQILISNDSVHYGDQGWGGKNYAPFGAGTAGLSMAKERDLTLIRTHLLGPIEPGKMKGLLYSLVDESDVHEYRVTWCGRFSVPFGVCFTYRLAEDLGEDTPHGYLLGYGTSVELGELPVRDLGLGVTAPANLHHWVAYSAVGYLSR